jgi:hypothetical protein
MPTQIFNIRNDGVGQAESSDDLVPVYLGIASAGDINVMKSGRDPAVIRDDVGQGPLSEDAGYHSKVAGTAKYMVLTPTVVGAVGATTTARIGSSTGTLAGSVTPATALSALQIDDPAGTPGFVDETADAASATAADVDPWPATEAVGDQFALGYSTVFNKINVTISTAGAGGTLAVKYWDGTDWTEVAGLSDASTGLTAGTSTYAITFTMPTDWVKRSLNSGPAYYYLVLEVAGSYSTNPVISQVTIDRQGPWDEYDVQVEITKTGTLGAGEFRYSLDGGTSWTPDLVIPSGGTYAVQNAGLTFTFTAGGGPVYFQDGDLFSFTCDPPYFDTTSLTAAVAALKVSGQTWDYMVFSGKAASASAAATLASALNTHCLDLQNNFKFGTGAIFDFGSAGTAALANTSAAAIETDFLLLPYGRARIDSAKPMPGWTAPMRSAVALYGAQAARVTLSGDLKRVVRGALPGVSAIEHDEELAAVKVDGSRLSTLRTWDGRAGVYIFQARIKSAIESDFRLWPHRQVMNRAARTIYLNAQTFIGRNPRVNVDASIDAGEVGAPGTLYEPDAQNLEAPVQRALRQQLTVPANADGNPGHVSDQAYNLDRTYDSKTNRKTKGVFRMVSLAYIDDAEHELAFAVAV